jgi:Fe-S cluster assembly protein SufD
MEINNQIVKKYIWSKVEDKILLAGNTDFKYLIISSDSELNLQFYTQWENIKWDIYAIFFGTEPLSASLIAHVHNSNSHINMFILSFIQSDNLIDIKGSMDLWKDIFNSQWHLLEKNIVIAPKWQKIKVKAIPRLDVYSNDVQASHWVSIDRIDEDSLFYLISKWLSNDSSQKLVTKWYIKNILEQFTDISDEEKQNIENTILSNIIL